MTRLIAFGVYKHGVKVMKLVALVATVFVFLTACSTDNYIISADEYHIAIQPRNDILYASDQILAAGTMAKVVPNMENRPCFCQRGGRGTARGNGSAVTMTL